MQLFGRAAIILVWPIAATLSIGVAVGCSCAPPPPPSPGTQPAVRIPSLVGKDSAVFVGVVKEVYPRTLSEYKKRWRQIYHEKLSEDMPPSLEQVRSFVLQFWPKLFSPSEQKRIAAANSIEDLESSIGRFWLT